MKNVAIISTSLNDGGGERIAGLLSKGLSNIIMSIFLGSSVVCVGGISRDNSAIPADYGIFEKIIKEYGN